MLGLSVPRDRVLTERYHRLLKPVVPRHCANLSGIAPMCVAVQTLLPPAHSLGPRVCAQAVLIALAQLISKAVFYFACLGALAFLHSASPSNVLIV